MSQEQWTAVDHYFNDHLHEANPALESALARSDEAGLPGINVAPNHGKFLMLLAMVRGATRVLEIGTLGGYSTIWLGRGIPADGHIDTLEFDPDNARVAGENIRDAGLEDRVVIHIGKALDTLKHLVRMETAPYDVIFLDADKASLPNYLEWSLKLARPGTVIIADNVVRPVRSSIRIRRMSMSRGCNATSRWWEPIHSLRQPRSRPSAARATTASRCRW